MVVIERECLGSHPLLRRRLTTVAQPPASAHAVPDHVIRDGPKFKRRFNSITGLFFCLPTVFFTNCAVRRIAIAACALESPLLFAFSCGESPRRYRAYPQPFYGKRPAPSTTVLVGDGRDVLAGRELSRSRLPPSRSTLWLCLTGYQRLRRKCAKI